MAVPDYQTLMLPLLELVSDRREHHLGAARDALAARLGLTAADREELLPSGRQPRFNNRVAWARAYLEAAGLIDSTRRGYFRITARGEELLAQRPTRIDNTLLERYEEFKKFRNREGPGQPQKQGPNGPLDTEGPETPEEALDRSYQRIRAELIAELLKRVKASTPSFFEQLVVELLLKMGYGRSRADAGRAIGTTGDEGIDGIISEDRLGLDNIYIQAKRWEGTVGRPEVQKFVGALHGKRARKGVFLTTGVFSSEATDFVGHIDPRVVLIDGKQLAEYMLDYDLGVTVRATYELKRIDSDYFSDE